MSFFKAYDMRGTYGVDFNLAMVRKIGRALPQAVKGTRWLVGRDCRTTSDAVRDALIAGLCESGAQVTDLGLCTTPMVYFFTAQGGYDGSVMITASHNPPTDNGLKVSKRGALPVGYADGLDEVERLVNADGRARTPAAPFVCPMSDTLSTYVAWQLKHANAQTIKQLRLAVDCSNGMSSLFVRDLFPDAVILNDKLDGTFPAHSPNPLQAAAREQLSQVVREQKLDCGVIFDGDADRAMFVDEKGDFVQPDYLIPIVAKATIRSGGQRTEDGGQRMGAGGWAREKPLIIHDVRTSRGAIETLREMGCSPLMVPVGHAFAKPILREQGALCGGELAGHYYFSEFFGCDSGVLAALRILSEIAAAKERGESFSEMMKPIVSRYANSGEMNFRVDDKDAAIARVLACAKAELPPEMERSEIDGIRLEFADGWINVRKSNTEPFLRLLVEARTSDQLADWTCRLKKAIGA